MRPSLILLCRYGATVPLLGLAVLITAFLTPLEQTPAVLFLAVVALSAWHGGLGPGLVATGLAVLALDYFFIPPVYALGVGVSDAVRLGVFALVAILISSIDEARKRLREKLHEENRYKEDFLAVLAHELRNPLTTSLHAVEVLRLRGGDVATVEKTRQVIERQLRTMTCLINDLLDVSRLRLGKLRLCKEPVDLCLIVEGALESARSLIESRSHRLEVSMPHCPLWLEADPIRLQQVIVNLLTNAAKYTAPEGRISLSVEASAHGILLRIQDNGVGFAPEVVPHLFDRFAQVESGSQGGLGVGLSLVRDLVELHGGTLTARSDGPGRGSEFTVGLPWQVPKDDLKGRVHHVSFES